MDQSSRKPLTDNRRDFLRESLMLAAVPAAFAGSAAEASLHIRSERTIRLGVLGCGRRGIQLAKAALASSTTHVQLCGLADVFPDRVQQTYRTINSNFSDRVLIESSTRFTGMRAAEQLAGSDVDAVIVAAAPGFRSSHLSLLSEAGKHLYIERPLAASREDTFQVAELARQACQQGISIQFGMQHRYQPFFISLIEQLQQGAIGPPVLARLTLVRPIEQPPVRSKRISEHDYRLRHWQLSDELGGHPIVEQLSGQLDLVNWIAGAAPLSAVPITSGGELTEVQFSYANGLRLDCQLTAAHPGKATGLTLLVQGTSGWCDVLQGKIYNQANRLQWSAVGAPADSQPAVDAWLANMLLADSVGALNLREPEIEATVEANLTALLGQYAKEQNRIVHWSSVWGDPA